jgi:hypothetical protein
VLGLSMRHAEAVCEGQLLACVQPSPPHPPPPSLLLQPCSSVQ